MKKQYIIPYMETVKIRTAHQILAGSRDAEVSSEMQSNEAALGRGFNGYDDDDE